MSSGARFRYALEPILLTRQWDLDALLAELSECNAAIAASREALAALRAQSQALAQEWIAQSDAPGGLSVDRFARSTRYLSDLARQAREREAELAALAGLREELAERVMASQRAVEAVEQHRDEMKSRFVQLRLSGDFKIADDQWTTLHAGSMANAS